MSKRTDAPVYQTWRAMIARCTNPRATNYPYYGGRGIAVCERWLSFDNFYADVGERPDGMTLDRIDRDGNYEPGNCRWATHAEQIHNRRWQRPVKITLDVVNEIRGRVEHGERQVSVARRLGLTRSQVAKVVTRIIWKSVP